MNLTKRMAIKLHRELWGWIYKKSVEMGIYASKSEWPGWAHNGGKYGKYDVNSECFPCEYALHQKGNHPLNKDDPPLIRRCQYCPLDWGITNTCLVPNSYYNKWIQDGHPMWAKQIRDLKERFYGRNKKKLRQESK